MNVAVDVPCGAVVVVGTEIALLVLLTLTAAPAEFERVTVQVLLLPTVKWVGLQVKESKVGVANRVSVAL